MTGPGGPRRGRHSSPDPATGGLSSSAWSAAPDVPGYGAPRYEPARYEPPTWHTAVPSDGADLPTAGFRRVPGVLDRFPDATGPLVEPEWWAYGSSDHPDHPLAARHGGDRHVGDSGPAGNSWGTGGDDRGLQHPSGPLPPRPPGVWDRLHPRDDADDAQTVAQPLFPGAAPRRDDDSTAAHRHDDDSTAAHEPHADDHDADDQHGWDDQTGGLDVIGAHVAEDEPRRRGRRARRGRAASHEDPPASSADLDHDAVHDPAFGEDIPVKPYDRRTGRARRRRRPVAVLTTLVLLAGVVLGIFLGGQKLLELIDPTARDYTGQGTGTVQVRVQEGDTLSDIARTLVAGDVVASTGPFVDAAEANAAAVGIQPGVYDLRQQMSGQAALDLLLDPSARLLSRVTLPEGLTVERTLARVAEETGRPLAEFEAAAADPAALGLPAYANGLLEGFLFPATYDFEPDDTPTDMLTAMVTRAKLAFDELQIPEADRLTVLTKASLVQAEASTPEDMAKVARVLENRLADGMPLQLDTTVNYANGKGGITTTADDRANPSLYNTYVHPGLPPGAINNPGEQALRAVQNPAPGDWRFFVVVDPDTGDTRFAVTKEEHDQNVLLFRQWLRENPEG